MEKKLIELEFYQEKQCRCGNVGAYMIRQWPGEYYCELCLRDALDHLLKQNTDPLDEHSRAVRYHEKDRIIPKNDTPQQATETRYDPQSRYYDAGGIETQDIIRAKLTPEQYKGWLLGNTIKYSCRLNFKGSAARDADKLAFYTMWLDGSMCDEWGTE